jgi:hypothetical protein
MLERRMITGRRAIVKHRMEGLFFARENEFHCQVRVRVRVRQKMPLFRRFILFGSFWFFSFLKIARMRNENLNYRRVEVERPLVCPRSSD